MRDASKPIKEDVWAVLRTDGEHASHTELRIVCWNDGSPVFEKRQFFKDKETGKLTAGKCRGLNPDEVRFIKDRFDEIMAVFERGDEFKTVQITKPERK